MWHLYRNLIQITELRASTAELRGVRRGGGDVLRGRGAIRWGGGTKPKSCNDLPVPSSAHQPNVVIGVGLAQHMLYSEQEPGCEKKEGLVNRALVVPPKHSSYQPSRRQPQVTSA